MPVGGGSSARAIEAGGAFVRIFSVNKDLQQGLARASAMVKGFASWSGKTGLAIGRGLFSFAGKSLSGGMAGIMRTLKGGAVGGLAGGAGTLGILGKALFGSIDRAKLFETMSAKLGETTDRLSAFAYAAESTGVSFEELADDFENWPERLSEAASGSGEAAEAFKKLHLTTEDLARIKELPITEQMIELSGAMQGVTNETDRLMLLGKFFSDKGQFLNALFKQGPAGIRAKMAEAPLVGAQLDPTRTKELADAGRLLDSTWTAVKSTFLEVGAALLPSREQLKAISDAIINGARSFREFIAENKGVVQIAALVAGGIAAVSGAFLLAGPAIAAFTTVAAIPAQLAIGALAAGAGLLASAMGVAGSAFAGTLGLIGASLTGITAAAGMLFTPGGLLVVGVGCARGCGACCGKFRRCDPGRHPGTARNVLCPHELREQGPGRLREFVRRHPHPRWPRHGIDEGYRTAGLGWHLDRIEARRPGGGRRHRG